MPKVSLFILSLCCFVLPAHAQVKAPSPVFSDGPYFFYQEQQVLARWMEKNTLKEETFVFGQDIEVPKNICPDFYLNTEDLEFRPVPQEQIHFETTAKIAALSDVHGQYDVTVKLLRENRIIDENNNWIFGNGHLVIVGDVFDRGEQVTELLWLLHKLDKQAPNSNGRVHILLGNHELMVLSGDYRFIHKKYRYTMAIMKMPLSELFGPDTYLGTWLRSKPIAISINDMAFVHGGFSELFLNKVKTIKEINTLGKKLMNADPAAIEENKLLNLMNTPDGPLWYRGYFKDEKLVERNVNNILKKLGMKHIIVGHTSHEAIMGLFNNKIIGVDSRIQFGKNGEILIRDRDIFYRGTIGGDRIRLQANK